ncbi:GNAT family N-acetyltransferase [Synechocystis sp. PCC 7339]|uniref:GNAT family N-acetyltransferase n=1 Tax=unclassified Synechocystis TaxID=2640012 RepID=UPI001BAEE906|nr:MULTISPECIES: GNAT family N-acetyltransferase [unclassified Synechocystis]QUS60801.1 GNAT family N-acetyltransferase [Synechocystis sp. PCC 7338]UAJ72991.1 GNAT family N-acetyltransferase [Synechocystis sp. PCC 7339]
MTRGKSFQAPIALEPSHDLGSFDCGVPELNLFLQKYALTNSRNHTAKTFVALGEAGQVIGFYSLVAGAVEHGAVPPRVSKGLGKYPIPVIVLARLAVDRRYQGLGLGKGLLKDALLRCLNVVEQIGARAIAVHAKDEEAAAFYERYDFERSPLSECHLYLLVKDISKTAGI